jgi:Glycoside hydrolase family 44
MRNSFARSQARDRTLFWLSTLAVVFEFAVLADEVIYDDSLQNGWADWSWATVNRTNTSPVYSGFYSISVTASNSPSDWKALYLNVPAMDTGGFTNLTFWINGGAIGGQSVQAQGLLGNTAQSPVQIGPLPANTWKQINLSLTTLGVANQPNFTGFWLQAEGASPVPTFYVDNITLTSAPPPQPGTNAAVAVQVDAGADRHPISPLIYGVAFAASSNDLRNLNAPLHRSGGNATTRYNWLLNATSHDSDWYFESLPESSSAPGGDGDSFIQESKDGGAKAMLTIPIIGWVANLGADRAGLASYSVAKYGAQTGADPWWSDAGNGVSKATGLNITNNDPTDANLAVDTNFQAGWVQHLTNQWGAATNGGLRYYLMDNEWSIWFAVHRDVHPVGATMDEVLDKFCDYAAMVKSIDPNAQVAGPEEWGWSGYFRSGYDQQTGGSTDRMAHGGQDFSPWFLSQVQERSQTAGKRLLDIFSLHYYPQSGEAFADSVPTAMGILRNRSTRSLWDTNYVDASWISSIVMLIPRMKQWVAANYPGALTGITEYNWGADDFLNGATAQADVLGIFGREGLDLATRWVCPASNTPAYYAFQMYRNYDGNQSTFGDTNVRAVTPNPDNLAAFAAVRSGDGNLTVMAINKDLLNATPLTLNLTNLPAVGAAQVWQLATTNGIARLPDVAYTNAILSLVLPAQSITLFVLPSVCPFRLRAAAGPSSGQLRFWLDGQVGRSYALQSSTDLVHWSYLNTNTLPSNSILYSVVTTNAPEMFYRGLLTSP